MSIPGMPVGNHVGMPLLSFGRQNANSAFAPG
jgi:hypothetical protein